MHAVEELQKDVWGVPDLDVVPLTHLVATKQAGGVLIGAFDGDALVGFVYGFHGYERGQFAHHSHMLGVKPAYRNFDLGRRLKLAQRDHVVAQGIELITWTFDPLQTLNAYFNFHKLGVVADRYLRDFYGEDATSFLHQTGTDRLWVSWFLMKENVNRVVSTEVAPLLQIDAEDLPQRNDLTDDENISIEIPGDIDALQQRSMETALKWRSETRWAFTTAFNAGYFVSGFTREQQFGRYLLSKHGVQI